VYFFSRAFFQGYFVGLPFDDNHHHCHHDILSKLEPVKNMNPYVVYCIILRRPTPHVKSIAGSSVRKSRA